MELRLLEKVPIFSRLRDLGNVVIEDALSARLGIALLIDRPSHTLLPPLGISRENRLQLVHQRVVPIELLRLPDLVL